MYKNKNDNDDLEIRSFPVEMRVMSPEGEEKPVIEGKAAVYGKKSEMIFNFREIIEAGFFENVLKQDVRALWNHNADKVLGRTKSRTLELSDDERSLNMRIHPPNTQTGKDALESIGRGDVDQMSFAFAVKQGGDEWVKERDGSRTRILKRGGCERLFDVSPVTYPAYPQTSVSVRSYLENLTQGGETPPLQQGEEQLENAEGLEPDAADEEAVLQVRAANRRRELEIINIKKSAMHYRVMHSDQKKEQ